MTTEIKNWPYYQSNPAPDNWPYYQSNPAPDNNPWISVDDQPPDDYADNMIMTPIPFQAGYKNIAIIVDDEGEMLYWMPVPPVPGG